MATFEVLINKISKLIKGGELRLFPSRKARLYHGDGGGFENYIGEERRFKEVKRHLRSITTVSKETHFFARQQ